MTIAATELNWDEDDQLYVLRLYVAGTSPNSVRAVSNIKRICKNHLKDNYDLEIVDVYQQLEKAGEDQLIALPLLVKKAPGQVRRLVGDMSDEEKVLKGLGVY
ncbi:MAG: circadian clock KaiB family protein [Bacteroidetes bacterium]|nr:circadian clock KaiB family protein [Bacteroidota bacterium]